ncbi:hypothetical protein B0H19DRAFT_1071801 [Mycena capillaripes]|nr:hypothetical protein B0H19DRAFT_1071801 [Mycena capillaripes]
MCDTIHNLKSAVLFWVLTSIYGTTWHYISLALAFIWLAFLAPRHYGPAKKLNVLEAAIKTTEETLERAKATCARSQMELIDAGYRLLQVKFSASKIQCQMLEARNASWKMYFKSGRALIRAIDQCTIEAKAIQTLMLLIIEEARQRKLTEGINESQEVLSAVVRLPISHAHLVHRRIASGATLSQESYKYVNKEFSNSVVD